MDSTEVTDVDFTNCDRFKSPGPEEGRDGIETAATCFFLIARGWIFASFVSIGAVTAAEVVVRVIGSSFCLTAVLIRKAFSFFFVGALMML